MHIHNRYYHTIWPKDTDPSVIFVIDQRKLPFIFNLLELKSTEDVFFAIRGMAVRGAPLIGITAAWGMYLALLEFKGGDLEKYMSKKADYLKSARPTSVNPFFNIDEICKFIMKEKSNPGLRQKTFDKVNSLAEREIQACSRIGDFGLKIIEELYRKKGETINILTHCNAGWLACIDWGTATAPVYKAHLKGIPVHVWVDETRPRNQGARLTAFELGQEGISHTVIADNTGGHLMQHGMVDMVIVGSDRTTVRGDVANKIGTYLKALAADDNNIPFYVALPSSSFDWLAEDGIKEIPIEERGSEEVAEIEGWTGTALQSVRIIPEKSKVMNYGFDVTPARLITGLITERGICKADKKSILDLFPERK
ncbi:MAG: S-methyl-5-thioribose-1-phosphate isomerase [Prolixibacteraceae bacterium]|nr:S-methyl-5-thioribose-1-phosphate isomerase [Prolixibacteraceae bacterium]